MNEINDKPNIKKTWKKPELIRLDINNDTFVGTGNGVDGAIGSAS